MMIMMAVAAAVGIGGASVISRRLGEKREGDANKVFGNILTMIFAVSIAGFLSAFLFLDEMLYLFGATAEILPYARDYLFPILIGTFFFPQPSRYDGSSSDTYSRGYRHHDHHQWKSDCYTCDSLNPYEMGNEDCINYII
jgi:hypothetical protein